MKGIWLGLIAVFLFSTLVWANGGPYGDVKRYNSNNGEYHAKVQWWGPDTGYVYTTKSGGYWVPWLPNGRYIMVASKVINGKLWQSLDKYVTINNGMKRVNFVLYRYRPYSPKK